MSKTASLVFLAGFLTLGSTGSCPDNSFWEPKWNKCMCNYGYEQDHYGKCVKPQQCPEFSSFQAWSKECVCWNGYKKQGDKCVGVPSCPWNHFYDQNKETCVSCPNNSLWEPNWHECVCLGGFEKVHGECLLTCPPNEVRKGYQCECNPGFYRINGGCAVCPAHSYYESQWKQCVCEHGYVKNAHGQCVDPNEKHEYSTQSYKSQHSDKSVKSTKYSEKTVYEHETYKPRCPANSHYEAWQDKCVCWNGFKQQGETCVPVCNEGQDLDQQSGKCIPRCPWNSYFNHKTYQCEECPTYSLWDPNQGQCLCIGGYQKVHDKCLLRCPNNEVRIGYSEECECKQGTYRINGSCGVCPKHSNYNSANQRCVCEEPLFLNIYGQCVKECKQNEVWNSQEYKCVCQWGFERNASGWCARKCPEDAYWETQWGKCVCNNGWEMIDGKCQTRKCPQNAYWENQWAKCMCNNGWDMVDGKCQKKEEKGYWNW